MERTFEDELGMEPKMSFLQNLSAIFESSIIVDEDYIIRESSPALCKLLGFESDVLKGKSISFLSYDEHLPSLLRSQFTNGFFYNYHTFFRNSLSRNLFVNVSAFQSKKINSAEENYMVLQIVSMEERQITEQRLVEKTRQLESLLHCGWHDLRGPIATIKGVVNLASMRHGELEVDLYFEWIRNNVELLDQQLRMLLANVHFFKDGSF